MFSLKTLNSSRLNYLLFLLFFIGLQSVYTHVIDSPQPQKQATYSQSTLNIISKRIFQQKKVETLSLQEIPDEQKNNQQNSHYNNRFQVKLQSLSQKNNQNKINNIQHKRIFQNIRLLSNCNVVGCSSCNQYNSSLCDKCQDSYVLDGGLCYNPNQLPSNCQSAQKVGNQVRFHCTLCDAGYTLDSNDLCKKCLVDSCSSCSIDSLYQCNSCLNGYFLTSENQTCSPCGDNCQSCISSNNCTSCFSGYILYSGSYCGTCGIDNCQNCSYSSSQPICNQCFGNYFLFNNQCLNVTETDNGTVSYSGFTFKCPVGCLKCSFIGNNNVCQQCDQGYDFNGTSWYCSKCQNNCKYCGNSSLSKCTDCFPGYALTGSTCTKCFIQNCAECDLSNATVCTKCADNYYLSSSGYCYLCNDGCKQCDESGNCSLCSYGYHLYGDQNGSMVCQSCISGCGDCQYWAGKCTECFPRFYLTTNQTCSPCQQGCWKCNSSTVCTKCDDDKVIINTACVDPVQNCKTLNVSGKCTQCLIGYYLNQSNNSCVYSYASSIIDSKRYSCSNDAYLYSSDCYLCLSKIDNCLSCQNSYCLKCAAGYYISNTGLKCLKCSINNCQQCSNQQICSKCQDGYYLHTDIVKSYQRTPISSQDLITSYGSCLLCSENCLTCEYRDNMCITCKSGYILTSSRNCITQNKFYFLMKINANFSTFASRVDDLKAQLVYLIQDDSNVSLCMKKKFIQLTGLSSGSVNVAGYVSATSPSNLQKTYDNFNALSTGGQLNLGFSIISSQLSNYQTASTNNSTTNSTNNSSSDSTSSLPPQNTTNIIPIIVGIAAGVIVLIVVIAVLVCCFCCKKKIEQMREISEDKKSSSTGIQKESNDKDEKQYNPDSQKYFNNPEGQNNQNWVSPQYYL